MDKKLIHNRKDEYGGISVHEFTDTGGVFRILTFDDDASQSAIKVGDPNVLVFPYSKHIVELLEGNETKLENILLLGLGGGTLPTWIHQNHPELNLKVVELREEVKNVAHEYFLLPKEVDVTIADGVKYPFSIGVRREDMIIIDMFGNNGIPESMESAGFIRGIHSILKKDGTVLLNIWPKDVENTTYINKWHKIFKEVKIWKVYGDNHVLVAKK